MQKVCHSEKSKFHTPPRPNRVTNGSLVTEISKFHTPSPLRPASDILFASPHSCLHFSKPLEFLPARRLPQQQQMCPPC